MFELTFNTNHAGPPSFAHLRSDFDIDTPID